jgi:hypothetical protein
MSRLDDYRTALLAAHPDVPGDELAGALDANGEVFARFIIDHGLGPLWHARTGREEFHESRMLAEALYLAQERALLEIGAALDAAAIGHVVIKGAAHRLLLYRNAALRACYDFDILVRKEDRLGAARTLVESGFVAAPNAQNISRALELSRSDVDVDLHWGLLREGRLRTDPVGAMLDRRRRIQGIWMQSAEDALFTLLVHPAFAKHLAGWNMGLHRVADLLLWLRDQAFEWPTVHAMLDANGVRAAAWATLRWAQLLAGEHAPEVLPSMLYDLESGGMRRRWIDAWLRNDLPGRTSGSRWTRLLGFSVFLHDTAGDALRAARGRRQASRRSTADLAVFRDLTGE